MRHWASLLLTALLLLATLAPAVSASSGPSAQSISNNTSAATPTTDEAPALPRFTASQRSGLAELLAGPHDAFALGAALMHFEPSASCALTPRDALASRPLAARPLYLTLCSLLN